MASWGQRVFLKIRALMMKATRRMKNITEAKRRALSPLVCFLTSVFSRTVPHLFWNFSSYQTFGFKQA